LIPPKVDALMKSVFPAQAVALTMDVSCALPSENCTKIRGLGFTASKHIKMYGERFELVSDPFDEDGCTVVHVISGNDPKIRTLRLPVAILVGLSGRFRNIQRL
jgi:hypothetical protein